MNKQQTDKLRKEFFEECTRNDFNAPGIFWHITPENCCNWWLDKLSKLESDEQPFCPYCGKYKRLPWNGIMHQLCECNLNTIKP